MNVCTFVCFVSSSACLFISVCTCVCACVCVCVCVCAVLPTSNFQFLYRMTVVLHILAYLCLKLCQGRIQNFVKRKGFLEVEGVPQILNQSCSDCVIQDLWKGFWTFEVRGQSTLWPLKVATMFTALLGGMHAFLCS